MRWSTENQPEVQKHTLFIAKFIDEIFALEKEGKIDEYDLRDLVGAFSGAHSHQDDTRTKNHTFFDLIGEDWEQKIRPAYENAKQFAEEHPNKIQLIDLDDPSSRGMFKEISMMMDSMVANKIRRELR